MAATSERSGTLPAQPPHEAGPETDEAGLDRAISEAEESGRIGRRVFRNVRRIELWSVFKVSLVFYACMYGVALAVIVLGWAAASENGLIADIEGFVNDVGWEDWSLQGGQMFRDLAFIGAVLVGVGAVVTTLAAALFNLVSEVLGGFRIIVIEEESVPTDPRNRRQRRQVANARVRARSPLRQRPAAASPRVSGNDELQGLRGRPPGWGAKREASDGLRDPGVAGAGNGSAKSSGAPGSRQDRAEGQRSGSDPRPGPEPEERRT